MDAPTLFFQELDECVNRLNTSPTWVSFCISFRRTICPAGFRYSIQANDETSWTTRFSPILYHISGFSADRIVRHLLTKLRIGVVIVDPDLHAQLFFERGKSIRLQFVADINGTEFHVPETFHRQRRRWNVVTRLIRIDLDEPFRVEKDDFFRAASGWSWGRGHQKRREAQRDCDSLNRARDRWILKRNALWALMRGRWLPFVSDDVLGCLQSFLG